jgi:hypothetical protein
MPNETRRPHRQPPRPSARVECRRGRRGRGPDLVACPLELSATATRLVLKERLGAGRAAEVLLLGDGPVRVKRVATVVRCALRPGGYVAALCFTEPVPSAALEVLAAAPRLPPRARPAAVIHPAPAGPADPCAKGSCAEEDSQVVAAATGQRTPAVRPLIVVHQDIPPLG